MMISALTGRRRPGSPGRLVAWLPGRQVAWSPGRLVAWLLGRQVAWSPGCPDVRSPPGRLGRLDVTLPRR